MTDTNQNNNNNDNGLGVTEEEYTQFSDGLLGAIASFLIRGEAAEVAVNGTLLATFHPTPKPDRKMN